MQSNFGTLIYTTANILVIFCCCFCNVAVHGYMYELLSSLLRTYNYKDIFFNNVCFFHILSGNVNDVFSLRSYFSSAKALKIHEGSTGELLAAVELGWQQSVGVNSSRGG